MSSRYVYRPGLYYGLTFLITYAFWALAYYANLRDTGGLPMLLGIGGMVVPFVVSLIMILTSNNSELKKDFVDRLFNLSRIRPKMLPAFLLIMPLALVASILLSLPLGGSLDQFRLADGFSFSTGAIPVLLFLVLAACLEELGWRGYGFESLQSRYGYLKAALVFSLLWSIWHIPLIFAEGQYANELVKENAWFAVNYFVSFIPLGVIVSWLCIKNRKSILAAVLFHFLVNIFQELFSITQTTKCIETLVLAIIAIGIVLLDRGVFLSREAVAEDPGLSV